MPHSALINPHVKQYAIRELRKVCESHARVTRLPRPFPAYAVYHLHPSYDYKGNGCSKRVETVGVYPFCPLPWVRQTLPPPQRRNPCQNRQTACAVRAHRTAGAEKSSPRGNVPLRGSRASDSACRCSCNFRLKTSQKVLYYNHYTKENHNLEKFLS